MNIQDIGVTGIIGLVILAFAVIGFLKGLVKTVLAVVCIGIGGYAALRAYEHANQITSPWVDSPGPWMPQVFALVCGIIAFAICRYLLRFIANPFNESSTGQKLTSGMPSAIFSLCSGLVILWLAFVGIRYGGSLAEIRYTKLHAADGDDSKQPLLMQAKNAFDSSSVGRVHEKTDPMHQPGKVRLCKLIILYHHVPSRVKLLSDEISHRVLNTPAFLELAYHKEVKFSADSAQPRELYNSPYIEALLEDQDFVAELEKIDPIILLDAMQ